MEASINELFSAVSETRVAAYMWGCGLAFLVCDTLSTLSREVEYIWSAKWSTVKALYLFMRYWTLCQVAITAYDYSTIQESIERCRAFAWFQVTIGGYAVLLLAVDVIFSIRLYALYKRSKKVLVVLSSLVLGEFVIQTYVAYEIGLSTTRALFIVPPGLPILGCLTSPNLRLTTPSWVYTPVVAVIFFLLMLYKFYESAKTTRSLDIRHTLSPLIKAFVRDGTIYFLLVVVTLLAGAFDSFFAEGPFVALYAPWSAASLAVTGTRLVLNLREAASCEIANHPGDDTRELETLRFCDRGDVVSYETM